MIWWPYQGGWDWSMQHSCGVWEIDTKCCSENLLRRNNSGDLDDLNKQLNEHKGVYYQIQSLVNTWHFVFHKRQEIPCNPERLLASQLWLKCTKVVWLQYHCTGWPSSREYLFVWRGIFPEDIRANTRHVWRYPHTFHKSACKSTVLPSGRARIVCFNKFSQHINQNISNCMRRAVISGFL
jgi:hypothetical protein